MRMPRSDDADGLDLLPLEWSGDDTYFGRAWHDGGLLMGDAYNGRRNGNACHNTFTMVDCYFLIASMVGEMSLRLHAGCTA